MQNLPFKSATHLQKHPVCNNKLLRHKFYRATLHLLGVLVVLGGNSPLTSNAWAQETALEIIQKVTQRTNPASLKERVTLTLRPQEGKERTRTFWLQQRKTPQGWQTRIEFLTPKDVAGTTLLILQEKKTQRQYLWLPRLRRTRRVTGKMRSSSFMGSDFSYEDLEIQSIKAAHYQRLADSSISNRKCYTIEVTPKDSSRSDYGKMIMQIDQELFVPLRVRYFHKTGKETKVLDIAPPSVRHSGKWAIPTQFTMTNLQTGHRSVLKIDKIATETILPDRLFNPGQLGK